MLIIFFLIGFTINASCDDTLEDYYQLKVKELDIPPINLKLEEFKMVSFYINLAMKKGLSELTFNSQLTQSTVQMLIYLGYTVHDGVIQSSYFDLPYKNHIIEWAGKPVI